MGLAVLAVVVVVVVVAAIRRPAGPASMELCQQGIAVRSPANTPGLVSDCAILLEGEGNPRRSGGRVERRPARRDLGGRGGVRWPRQGDWAVGQRP